MTEYVSPYPEAIVDPTARTSHRASADSPRQHHLRTRNRLMTARRVFRHNTFETPTHTREPDPHSTGICGGSQDVHADYVLHARRLHHPSTRRLMKFPTPRLSCTRSGSSALDSPSKTSARLRQFLRFS